MPWRFNPINLNLEFIKPFIYIPTAEINFENGDLSVDMGDHSVEGDIDQGERIIDGDI
jgi:hypothetical protein